VNRGNVRVLDKNLVVYLGGGCNSVVLTSIDGKEAIIVDTKWLSSAKRMRNLIKAPKVTIINTHFHMDHSRGNGLYPEAHVVSGEVNWRHWDFDSGKSKRPDRILRTGDKIVLKLDDELIHIWDLGPAHSENDSIVFFEKRKLLVVGDLVVVNQHPVLIDKNTNLSMWRQLLDLIEREIEFDTLVPGHGPLSDKAEVLTMKRYFAAASAVASDSTKFGIEKQNFQMYSSFPVFGSFRRTISFMRREIEK